MKNKNSAEMKKVVARKVHISVRYIEYLLLAERDCSANTAKKLERATGIPRTIWTFGSKRDRQSSWKKFVRENNA